MGGNERFHTQHGETAQVKIEMQRLVHQQCESCLISGTEEVQGA